MVRCAAAAMKTLGDGAVAERRAVVLGEVVAVEPGLLVALDQREAVLECRPSGSPLSSMWSNTPNFIRLPPSRGPMLGRREPNRRPGRGPLAG